MTTIQTQMTWMTVLLQYDNGGGQQPTRKIRLVLKQYQIIFLFEFEFLTDTISRVPD